MYFDCARGPEVVSGEAVVLKAAAALAPGRGKEPAACLLLLGRSITPLPPPSLQQPWRKAEATKDRTRGAPYDPSGDKAAGPRGPSAPGSGDHLKEKACAAVGSARMSLLYTGVHFLFCSFCYVFGI